jgi:3-phenylpropionate/trans-cinnamate dioxygenase ferredoxin component
VAERHLVAAINDIPIGSLRRVDIGPVAICLVRTEAGEVFAVSDTCSHQFYSLSEGELIGAEIECPQHSSRFDIRTGDPTGLPATEAIEVYTVRVEGPHVYIDL